MVRIDPEALNDLKYRLESRIPQFHGKKHEKPNFHTIQPIQYNSKHHLDGNSLQVTDPTNELRDQLENYPKISIVTPNYNQGKFLERCIDSILSQEYPNLEYIIMDGESTDSSVEIIKQYEKNLKCWASEKDKGQADAINKGLRYVTGEIFNWLNSDDYLEPGALFRCAEAYWRSPHAAGWVGGCRRVDPNGKILNTIYPKF